MANINLNIRMDAELKKQFEAFCDEVGMSMTTAINVFVKRVVRDHEFPFDIEIPNEETLAAMREVEEIEKDPSKYKAYNTAEEMIRDILSELDHEEGGRKKSKRG